MHRLKAGLLVALLAFAPVQLGWTQARTESLQIPNLVPFEPFDIKIAAVDGYELDDRRAPRALRFSVSSRDVGDYPLELEAPPVLPDELVGTQTRKPAYQCVQWVSRACTDSRPVGDLIWHEAHQHWHFENYARYELRRLGADNKPDFSPDALVAPGTKASFCLEDTEPPGANPGDGAPSQTDVAFYFGCDEIRQGISPGWADTYGFALPGQQIPLDGVAPGDYALVVTVDPDHRLYETSYDDNVSFRVVTIPASGGKGDVISPVTTVSTSDGAIIAPNDRVEGLVTDDGSGVAYVMTSWRDARGVTTSYPATMTCADDTHAACTWWATNTLPGKYVFSAVATDREENEETVATSISIVNV